VDRFFLGDQARLQDTLLEMGEALRAQVDPAEPVRDLVHTLPRRLDLRFAALYRPEGAELVRVAGPEHLPERLPGRRALHDLLQAEGSIARVGELDPAEPELDDLLRLLEDRGVEVLGELASPRNRLGLLLLSGKSSQLAWERKELELLRGVLSQAAIALETSRLLEERTRQAELERELEIAAEIQSSVLPERVALAPGWRVAAVCRPARHVGGDFFSELPTGRNGHDGPRALIYADVAGKSVPAALMMMAAQEVLHSIAMTHPEPELLLELANRRLYQLRRHSFVALGYLAAAERGRTLTYVLAGQPGLLRRSRVGRVDELPLDPDRLPLGALLDAPHRPLAVDLEPGDVVLGYSDGVIEASSPTGEFFGVERLVAALERGPAEPEGAIHTVLDAVDRFTGGHPPYDDLTLVAVSRQPEEP
jgi:serine phosphatase RsbU (regulator of sigma subunit)